MKIYSHTPNRLVRLQIIKQGDQTQYLTLSETTMKEVEAMCRKVIENQNLSVFETGRKTAINIRESIGGLNGKSKTISFRGLDTIQTLNVILNHLKVKNNEQQ